jgi:hypothetical protein
LRLLRQRGSRGRCTSLDLGAWAFARTDPVSGHSARAGPVLVHQIHSRNESPLRCLGANVAGIVKPTPERTYRVGVISISASSISHTWVESRCGAVALGRTYLLPPLSSGGALVVPPWLRFHIPLIGDFASAFVRRLPTSWAHSTRTTHPSTSAASPARHFDGRPVRPCRQ